MVTESNELQYFFAVFLAVSRRITFKFQSSEFVDHESFETPLEHGQIWNPISHNRQRVHRDIETSEKDSDDHQRRSRSICKLNSGGQGADSQPQRAGHEVLHHDDQHEVQKAHPALELHQIINNEAEDDGGQQVQRQLHNHFSKEVRESIVCSPTTLAIDNNFLTREGIQNCDDIVEGLIDDDEEESTRAVLDAGLRISDVVINAANDEGEEDREDDFNDNHRHIAGLGCK
mmetsp:Transcript_5381/g.7450  ORF Transcript_5381/g.7450 Transcript_5381/m.7450 type:complete len:231 (-) Transcript_5381:286-978(-)